MIATIPPVVTIVAGPNGAGKSTFTAALRAYLSVPVIDPDAIARDMAPPTSALAAGREAIRQRDHYLAINQPFLIETTLSGGAALRFMDQATYAGFTLDLVYISVENVQTLIDRIVGRVAQGGHHVPEEDVRRRYTRSLRNLAPAIGRASQSMVYDNSLEGTPQHVLTIMRGQIVERAVLLPSWVQTYVDRFLSPPKLVD